MHFLKDLLIKTKAIIATRETWTTEFLARDAHGEGTGPNTASACQWCLLGAISKVCGPSNVFGEPPAGVIQLERLLHDTARELHYITPIHSLSYVNDVNGFDAVHKLLDIAIEKTE